MNTVEMMGKLKGVLSKRQALALADKAIVEYADLAEEIAEQIYIAKHYGASWNGIYDVIQRRVG